IEMKINNENGFSIIEILIAVTVFAIGILAVSKMQVMAIKTNHFANCLTDATTLAQDRMEELMGFPYTDSLNFDNDGDGTNQDLDNDGVDDNGNNFGLDDANMTTADHGDTINSRYNIFWNIATDHPINNTKTIKVNINWTDRGIKKTVSITSIKAIAI
ncbi:MAG: prepilin-type N-terminal cleavage/methylation domain-containing protein, partial [Deltaproteobacteria bacterium]|nr:prepilin-type N-terminal cleavage/methylation domain-containing protein [Deltaproteobacteria bacterium]MBW1963932.1 prepilin-type N-terminal cleavage/methylation domain-containing protein [Deltaproteobacteria bacterium]